MELRDSFQWRMANLYVLAYVIVAAIISLIPARRLWFGFISGSAVDLSLTVASGVAVQMITRKFVQAFDAYDPGTPLQAKRANEQIKLTATFSNAIATAIVAVLVLSQSIKDTPPQPFHIITGIIIAGMVHVGGRNLIGLLKAEKADDLISIRTEAP